MGTEFRRLALAILLLIGIAGPPLAASAQGTVTYFVSNVDASQFPDITFELRAVDLNNQVVTNLNSQSLSVYENGQLVSGVQATPRTDGPINVIYVVDLGRYINYQYVGLNNIRLAISTLVTGGYFTDDRDSVRVLARQNVNSDQTLTLWPTTSRGDDLTNWAANFSFPRGNGATKSLLGVEDAIKAMADQVPTPGTEAAAIVFLTRYIEDPNNSVATTAAQTLALSARQNYVSVFVFHTDSSSPFDQPLRLLASGSGGAYAPLKSNNVATTADSIYQVINAQRTVYTVSYRSPLGTSGPRQITIDTGQPPSAGVTGSYEVTVVPPAVSVLQPAAASLIRREARLSVDGTNWTFDTIRVPVTAQIDWPEGTTPRAIRSAELLVGGIVQDKVEPAPGASLVELEWDISDFVTPGVTPAKLEVRLTDELSVEAVGEVTVNIEVVALPTPTPEPAPGPLAAVTDGLRQYGLFVAVPLVCLGGLFLLGVAVVLFLRPKRSSSQPARARAVSNEPDHTLIVGSPAKRKGLGTLTVLAGPKAMIGEGIGLTKPVTLIGRSPDKADVVFYVDESSSVSRIHCTLQLDGMNFVLTDNGSSNGTKVNGVALNPNDPTMLRDGDEIVLGDLGRLGVKLRFNLPVEKSESDLSDRTHYIVSGNDEDEWSKFKDA